MFGLLLVQLGTPRSPSVSDVRRYLREFLMDSRVIDWPTAARFLLVNGIIVPFRAPKSAHAYKSIWRDDGSPLRVFSNQLTQLVQQHFDRDCVVRLAMRYGEPAISEVLDEFEAMQVSKIFVVPLYPQYASATTASVVDSVGAWVQRAWHRRRVQILKPFPTESFFVDYYVRRIREMNLTPSDHLVLSYHGLPESQILESDATHAHCLQSPDCCERKVTANALCYRAQCYQTSLSIVTSLNLRKASWTMSFQSRLGRARWIGPSTSDILSNRSKESGGRTVVACPSFVADCLETLEEIGIREREKFVGRGFELVPCPNADATFVQGFSEWVLRSINTGDKQLK